MATAVDSAHVERLSADAEQLARSITADDERTLALTVVRTGAARTDPGHASALLTEAEQFARTSSSSAGTRRWERWP